MKPHAPSLRLLLVVIAFAIPTGAVSACGGGDVASGPIVGAILNELTGDVNNIVQTAGSESRATTLAAAAAVQDAINNAESAFAADLNKTIEQVDESVRGNVNRLQAMVADLKRGTQETLKAAAADAQQLLNSLPFTNRNPQVKRYSPVFVTQGGPPSFQVRIEGNFVYAQQKNQTPTLRIGGQTLQPNLVTTQELGFTVPVALLPTPPPKQLASTSMELDAPYEKGAIFKKQDLGTFRLLVSVLPERPINRLTLINEVKTSGTERQSLVAPAGAPHATWDLNSYDCEPHTRTESVAASPGGWKIVPSTAAVHVTWNKNPSAANVELNALQSAVVTVGHTRPACFAGICNGCGRISWYVAYDEIRPWEATAEEQKSLTLKWGEVTTVPVTPNRWRLSAELFDGRTYEVATTDNSSQYLSVLDLGSKITIQTPATDAFFAQ